GLTADRARPSESSSLVAATGRARRNKRGVTGMRSFFRVPEALSTGVGREEMASQLGHYVNRVVGPRRRPPPPGAAREFKRHSGILGGAIRETACNWRNEV